MVDALHRLPDAALEDALRDVGTAIAWPTTRDLGAVVGARVAALPPRTRRRWLPPAPLRRSTILALAALILLAAVAAAVALGVPGIRITLLPGSAPTAPPPTPTPATAEPLGAGLGLGTALPLDEAAAAVGFRPLLPDRLGDPDAVWVAGRRLTLVYPSGPSLPPTEAAGVGLLVTQFRGRVEPGYYEKQVHEGTVVEPVTVGDRPARWLTGGLHFLVYVAPGGEFVEESRRTVGDVLIVDAGDLTLRVESSLGRDATIRVAEEMIRDQSSMSDSVVSRWPRARSSATTTGSASRVW